MGLVNEWVYMCAWMLLNKKKQPENVEHDKALHNIAVRYGIVFW